MVNAWKLKQNRSAAATVQLTAVVLNMFKDKDRPPVDPTDLLPFPPSPEYSSPEQSEAALERFFGRINKPIEVSADG